MTNMLLLKKGEGQVITIRAHCLYLIPTPTECITELDPTLMKEASC